MICKVIVLVREPNTTGWEYLSSVTVDSEKPFKEQLASSMMKRDTYQEYEAAMNKIEAWDEYRTVVAQSTDHGDLDITHTGELGDPTGDMED